MDWEIREAEVIANLLSLTLRLTCWLLTELTGSSVVLLLALL